MRNPSRSVRTVAAPFAAVTAAVLVVSGGCAASGGGSGAATHAAGSQSGSAPASPAPSPSAQWPGGKALLPGMPPPLNNHDVYAADAAGKLSPEVRGDPALVYVPDTKSNDVYVIDQKTMKVVNRFDVGAEPQHVVPSYDLRTLYVAADKVPGGSLTPINPRTGKPGAPISVQDPYNLYFTPDGRFGIVVAEAYTRLDFYNPHTWKLEHRLELPQCRGLDHMDFTADGRLLLASCEFAGRMVVVDVATQKYLRTIPLRQVADGMPQDVKLSPDGRTFYVADMKANGVYLIDGQAKRVLRFMPTGAGAHGLYVDRDSRRLFVTNRGEGSITVLNLATQRPITTWHLPGGGSPDMGGVSADGSVLWLSGRYDSVVYAIRTSDGRLLSRIPVGNGPHGLCVWPQPGRYSLGHTGILR
ncbi:MAG TPA: hypothetical protein VFX70_02980 [Mycobacteriales bacterium]|nr:hypothetical protein [Mycobacteriales bacterium]